MNEVAESSPLISLAIPVYEMHGYGVTFLEFSFTKIISQTYNNIQVVISDHSISNDIQELCNSWTDRLNILYLRNENNRGNSSSNINNAINNCDGELIKILFQDDFLIESNVIYDIVNSFKSNQFWLVCACTHSNNGIDYYNNFYPKWNSNIVGGMNTISSPSVLTIRKSVKERFDENLIWLMDCDFYMQLYIKYGLPVIHNNICIVNRIWGNRLSDTIPETIKKREELYMRDKFYAYSSNSSIFDKLYNFF
ncbi:glycosyltransferase [Aquirufa sp. A-Brett2-W8]|jgi:hypothetical protein